MCYLPCYKGLVKMMNLVGLIGKMAKKFGTERADNILAGMLLIHKSYYELKAVMEKFLEGEADD